jgi:hypothetical protein
MHIKPVPVNVMKHTFTVALMLAIAALYPAAPIHVSAESPSIPLRVAIVLAERTPGFGSDTPIFSSLKQVLEINRLPFDVLDIFASDEGLVLQDAAGNALYSSLVMMVPGYLINAENSRYIVEAASLGTGVVSVIPNAANAALMPLLGIDAIGTNWIPSEGIIIDSDIFTLSYTGVVIGQTGLSLLDHKPDKEAVIVARDASTGLPAIWTYYNGTSRSVYFNDTGTHAPEFQGLVLQAILYSMPIGLASPVNAGAVQVEGSPQSYYSAAYLQDYYYGFVSNFITFLEAYNLKSTLFTAFSYSGNISDFWIYPESLRGVYAFRLRGDEIGLYCGSTHLPLAPQYWGSASMIDSELQEITGAIGKLESALRQEYGLELGQIVSYAAPRNEIGGYGYRMLDELTGIKYVGTMVGVAYDIEEPGTPALRNFGWEPGTGIYNLPRSQGDFFTFSGKADSDASYNAWSTLRSLIESGQPYLIFTHPDEYLLLNQVQYPGTGMEDIFAGATAWADYVSQNYPYYRWVTTAELGEIMVSRSGPLDARWLAGDNILEITGHSPSEALQIKTPLYLSSIREAGNRLEFSFSQTPVEIQTPGYDIVKTGQNYMIYPSGSSTYMPQTPDQDFVFAKTSPPAVETRPATQIDTSTATINGRLTSLGSAKSAEVYFEWGLTPSYENTTPALTLTKTGDFNAVITGLTPEETYYFRAKSSAQGIATGADLPLVTEKLSAAESRQYLWFLLTPLALVAIVILGVMSIPSPLRRRR